MNLVVREKYLKEIREYLRMDKSILGVTRGRRRIGKSFFNTQLANEDCFECLNISAIKTNKQNQIINFKNKLAIWLQKLKEKGFYIQQSFQDDNEWLSIFNKLGLVIAELNKYNKENKKIIIVLDEFQWFCSAKSYFLEAFMGQWNDNSEFGFQNQNLLMIACGSNTIWLEDNLLKNKTGLHQRIMFDFNMKPFTLLETKHFLKDFNCNVDTLVNYYLITGGVAQYLSLLKPELSFEDNVKRLYYSGVLQDEFKEIFSSLFNEKEHRYYEAIVDCFSDRKSLTFEEIKKEVFNKQGTSNSEDSNTSKLYKWLGNLVGSGFLARQNTKGQLYKGEYVLTDLYCHFYLKYIKKHKNFSANDNNFAKWRGYAFELLVLNNISLIKEEIGVYGNTEEYYWQNNKAQIDLLMERVDCDTIVEAKCYNTEFVIDSQYCQNLLNKKENYLQAKREERKRFNKEINFILVSIHGCRNAKNVNFPFVNLSLSEMLKLR